MKKIATLLSALVCLLSLLPLTACGGGDGGEPDELHAFFAALGAADTYEVIVNTDIDGVSLVTRYDVDGNKMRIRVPLLGVEKYVETVGETTYVYSQYDGGWIREQTLPGEDEDEILLTRAPFFCAGNFLYDSERDFYVLRAGVSTAPTSYGNILMRLSGGEATVRLTFSDGESQRTATVVIEKIGTGAGVTLPAAD